LRLIRRILLGALLIALAAYVIWGFVESRRLSADIARIAARGEPTVLIDHGQAVLTDEQRDAARIYAAAIERIQEAPPDEAFQYRRLDVDNPAGAPVNLADLEARYRKDTPALQLLDQATPLDFKEFGSLAPALYRNQEPLTALSGLNALRADLLSMRGRGDEAANVLVPSVRMQRTMPLSLYRYHASSRLLGSLRILLRHSSPTESSLLTLQRAFESLPDSDTLTQEMMQSRAQFLDAIARPAGTMGEAVAERVLRPWFASEARRQLRLFDEALVLTRGSLPERFDRVATVEGKILGDMRASQRRARWLAWIMPRRGAVFVGTSLAAAAYDLAARRIAIATLAVERYRRAHGGALPPGLDGLVPAYLAAVPEDPFSGTGLIYVHGPADYRVYSIDTNRRDDGGELYGIGSGAQLMPRSGAPRDYGIRVPLTPVAAHKEKP
jgi:hypothetical protein